LEGTHIAPRKGDESNPSPSDVQFSLPGTHERVDLDDGQVFVSLAAPSPLDHVLQVYSSLTDHM
jgi:hypothetical protein